MTAVAVSPQHAVTESMDQFQIIEREEKNPQLYYFCAEMDAEAHLNLCF